MHRMGVPLQMDPFRLMAPLVMGHPVYQNDDIYETNSISVGKLY